MRRVYEVRMPIGHKLWDVMSQTYANDAEEIIRKAARDTSGAHVDMNKIEGSIRVMRIRVTNPSADTLVMLTLPAGLWTRIQ